MFRFPALPIVLCSLLFVSQAKAQLPPGVRPGDTSPPPLTPQQEALRKQKIRQVKAALTKAKARVAQLEAMLAELEPVAKQAPKAAARVLDPNALEDGQVGTLPADALYKVASVLSGDEISVDAEVYRTVRVARGQEVETKTETLTPPVFHVKGLDTSRLVDGKRITFSQTFKVGIITTLSGAKRYQLTVTK